ncbi:hypothetical protein POM88_040994 [Heracleum sosnowskyi]|uniref:Uncharacterized protein n=1 Tax=Heracleum sosnowskyi TaxID=360622 RepID=A0AAD8MAY9_9APIA|nr:hypothetical protein POM88_040994 [Heracleum sosnowskyi]
MQKKLEQMTLAKEKTEEMLKEKEEALRLREEELETRGPSFALGYPLCASIQAIETNSIHDMRKMGTSPVASRVDLCKDSSNLMLLQVVFDLLNKNQDLSCGKESFLVVAQQYVDEHGTEALEKLISLRSL